jgi:dihydrofolate synthase/folylpolyglutamate synthase
MPAAHLARNLESMGFFPLTFAVFGILADKDIDGVIGHMKGVVDHWICCSLPGPRGSSAEDIEVRLRRAGIEDRTDARAGDRQQRCSRPDAVRGACAGPQQGRRE